MSLLSQYWSNPILSFSQKTLFDELYSPTIFNLILTSGREKGNFCVKDGGKTRYCSYNFINSRKKRVKSGYMSLFFSSSKWMTIIRSDVPNLFCARENISKWWKSKGLRIKELLFFAFFRFTLDFY